MSQQPAYRAKQLHFIGKSAPPGYVAGIGRGATGFTTRSDIGPAREAAAAAALAANSAALAASSSQRNNQSNSAPASDKNEPHKRPPNRDDDDEDDEYFNESNYDHFAGYMGSLVNKDPYEEDDEEADQIYEAIDKHLDERGKALREAKRRQEREKYRQEKPKIQQLFSDLKQGLSKVSEQEWISIPEVGDARNRRQRVARHDKFTPVPDSLLAHQMRVATGGERVVYIDPNAMETDDQDDDEGQDNNTKSVQPTGKNASAPSGMNIDEWSDLRNSYMSAQLSRVSNPVLNTAVDPKEYLAKYETLTPTQITDESTLKEFRKQYASLRNANPNLTNVWIASVRLEEAAGKLSTARTLILEGCKKCPKSVDLWLEAVRIHPPDTTQSLMVKAIKENPRSVRLWIKAADLENDVHLKRKVFEKARTMVPKSALIWKKSVELEPPNEAAKILREAIECCPESVELFLALARLEPYEQAQRILAKASERHPAEKAVWIMKAKLEEAVGHDDLVGAVIKTAIDKISKESSGQAIKRDEWLAEAVAAEKASFMTTCHEIIKQVIGLVQPAASVSLGAVQKRDKDEMKRKKLKTAQAGIIVKKEAIEGDTPGIRLKTWTEDIRKFVVSGSLECARAVYEFIVADGSGDHRQVESNWISYAEFEQNHGTSETFEAVLKRAISIGNCPRSETLWLMLAKIERENLHYSRQILSDALDAIPDSEKIILEMVEIECKNGNHKGARRRLADACIRAKTPELIKRSAKLEWALANFDEAIRILSDGSNEFKDNPDFYLMLGQIEEQRNDLERAKVHYSNGLKFNPTSIELWMSLAKAEEKTGFYARARSKLEMARLRNPKCSLLWLESARFEIRVHQQQDQSGNKRRSDRPNVVSSILSKGIKECKDCADVDTLRAELEAFNKRKYF